MNKQSIKFVDLNGLFSACFFTIFDALLFNFQVLGVTLIYYYMTRSISGLGSQLVFFIMWHLLLQILVMRTILLEERSVTNVMNQKWRRSSSNIIKPQYNLAWKTVLAVKRLLAVIVIVYMASRVDNLFYSGFYGIILKFPWSRLSDRLIL